MGFAQVADCGEPIAAEATSARTKDTCLNDLEPLRIDEIVVGRRQGDAQSRLAVVAACGNLPGLDRPLLALPADQEARRQT